MTVRSGGAQTRYEIKTHHDPKPSVLLLHMSVGITAAAVVVVSSVCLKLITRMQIP
jgi:hypothetical protein